MQICVPRLQIVCHDDHQGLCYKHPSRRRPFESPDKVIGCGVPFLSLNLNAPVEKTLQKHFTKACSVASAVLEESLSQNRSVVRDYLQVVGRSDDPDCPSASVSLDGQFNRPIYHGYDGKSTSVSEPVIENETNLNLLVSHAVVSKLDGTYEKEKVIFLIGETFSQNVYYCHSFFFGTFYSKLAYKWG